MVSDPIDWVDRCVRVKGDRVIGQIEHMSDQSAFIRRILELGIKAGLAVDIETELLRIDPNVIRNLEILILMTYPAGKGGQDMNEGIYDKIEQLKEIKLKGGYNFNICLDGGITLDNIKRVKLTGIDEVAIGNRIIDGDIEENLEEFYRAMY
jgi:ribulose-phosphate 3-epimerase